MQIEIYNPAQGEPLPPVKWNYEELKGQLVAALESYKGRIYTEETISEAKKDRASLNKLASAIDTRRKEMKARYLAPYEEFEAQAVELTGLVKQQAAEIDAQVKAFDEARRAEKQEHIRTMYAAVMGDLAALVPYERLHNPKWLNVTTSMNAIEAEIIEKAENIRAAMASIDALGLADDMAAQVKHVYLERLDLAAALAERDRIERERQALAAYEATTKGEPEKPAEQQTVAQPPEPAEKPTTAVPAMYTVDFRVWATAEQLAALKTFLVDNGVKYGKVPAK